MCDLIDLNSPGVTEVSDPKLTSPLIPIPRDAGSDMEGERIDPSVTRERRESSGSNPFDKVLHETTEYVQRKGDPFEVMLQRALKSEGRRRANPRRNFLDDFTPRRRRRYLKAINKTLDESPILADEVHFFGADKKVDDACDNAATIDDTNRPIVDEEKILKDRIPDVNTLESSILSQTAMNDTLLEENFKSKEKDATLALLKEDALFKEFIYPASASLGALDLQRSLSQGDGKLPDKLQCPSKRCRSVADNSRRQHLQSDSSTVSFLLDKGFVQTESKHSEQSVFSNLSNVSSITKLSSILQTSSLSSLVSPNDTMNNAFLEGSLSRASGERTENSTELKPMRYDVSDLVERFNKLKCAINGTAGVRNKTEEMDESSSVKKEEYDDEEITNDKLIDVDVFVPESSFSREHDKSTTSTNSSDSVFINSNKFNKLISNEAHALARTFEELALQTDSESSINDLISNNTLWMSELLPAFEDEAVVHDLIELPISPKEATKDDTKESPASNVQENSKGAEFTDCVSAVKETVPITLLLDLKNLIKTKNNSEAIKLIDKLENVLQVRYKSNTELLATYLSISNELHSSELSDDKSMGEKDMETMKTRISVDESQEENKKGSSEERVDSSSDKSPPRVNRKLQDTSRDVDSDDSSSSTKVSSYKDDGESRITNSSQVASSASRNKDNVDEKLAVELLINLGKVLSGQAKDATTLELLRNIGKALNVASSNLKIGSESRADDADNKIVPAKTWESQHDARRFATETMHERSFDLKSKSEGRMNRSLSVIRSTPIKNTNATQIHKNKSTIAPKDVEKRFSSSNVRVIAANERVETLEARNAKNESAKLGSKKEKTLAIIDVKNKFKKRSDIVDKRGPIKAVHPVGTMTKRASLGRQMTRSTTPPRSNKTTFGSKIISSTPNSVDTDNISRKVVQSKPMASSTPDGQHSGSRASNVHLLPTGNCKKQNFSCDISPVTTYATSNNNNNVRKDSPTRSTKLPTPKKCTPKRSQTNQSGIPKYLTPPRKLSASFDMNYQSLLESPQYLNKSLTRYQRYSSVGPKKSAASPLKDSNKITKVKPFKLISKFKRHGTSDFAEKENI